MATTTTDDMPPNGYPCPQCRGWHLSRGDFLCCQARAGIERGWPGGIVDPVWRCCRCGYQAHASTMLTHFAGRHRGERGSGELVRAVVERYEVGTFDPSDWLDR